MGKLLTDQKLRFAQGRAQGMTGEEAVNYAGYKSKGKAARVQCARLLANDSVTAEIERLREESRSESVLSAQDVKEGLSRLMGSAETHVDYTGYVALAGRLAKMEGHDEPERHELKINDLRQIVARARAKETR